MLDREKFPKLLDKYYELSGWSLDNGYPTSAKLQELGLDDVAEELKGLGKIGL